MGFNPPVPQQDSNWEIRVAVLLSLVLQVLLIFLGPTRKRSSGPWARMVVWSCYLLADWVADLALGLLLNSLGNIGGGGGDTAGNNNNDSSPVIFAFWTPFLLLHLGGPDTITAYSVEDNELWNRHLIGLLLELFSAAVIILCSLGSNPLIPATFLVLVAGVIKYGERTYSLYSGSYETLRDSIIDPPEPGPNYAKLMMEFDSRQKAGLDVEITIAGGEARNKEIMEQEETKRPVLDVHKSVEARAYELFRIFRRLFVDLILSFKERRFSQAFFREKSDLKPREAFEIIEVELNFIYDMFYTKAPVAHTVFGWALRVVCSGCLVAALVIFFLLDKHRHKVGRVDAGITYALLLGGLALDVAALFMLLFSNRATIFLEEQSQQWPMMRWLARLTRAAKPKQVGLHLSSTSQLELIGYCLGKPDNSYSLGICMTTLAKMLGAEEMVDDLRFIRRVPLLSTINKSNKNAGETEMEMASPSSSSSSSSSSSLLDFIFDGLKAAAAQKLETKEEIMAVCNRRGEGVIGRLEKQIKDDVLLKDKDDEKFNTILDSVSPEKADFDESLLMWHVATDLCRVMEKQGPPTPLEARLRPIGETLSEYMLYLLVKQTDMLSATAGIGMQAYRDTRAEISRFFSLVPTMRNPMDARVMLLSVNTSQKPSTVKGDLSKSVLFDAVILAKALRDLHDDELMWEVVAGVWGEMLTYAAGKCRGSTHVQKLNRGGELITLVWLLMEHMGLSDMYRIQERDAKSKLIVRH
ncbi:unnamed protein product [Urochloa decumbens]|uniref:DUF4220 domain-containing protein n=1 Tax=Urochloa decumbens TaxID=240449 RepID=A0ABC9HCY1_9POAL